MNVAVTAWELTGYGDVTLQETFLDPFEGGRFLTRAELQDILLHIVPDNTNPEYLRAIRNRDVWCALLTSL